MSFTAFKSILIFSELLEGPKSYKDLQEFMENHEYLHEKVSIDTLRIYINSLREIGCDVLKKTYDGVTKYSIQSHPFKLNFTDEQVNSIIKVFKAISKSIEVSDLISLQKFCGKISDYIDNDELKNKLQKISPIHNIKPNLIEDLISYTENNNEIVIYYNSGNTGRKNITVLADRLHITNGKLYLSGYNSEYQNYSDFLVSRILKIVSVNLHKKTLDIPEITVGYELVKEDNKEPEILKNEKIVKSDDNKALIEITSKNKFEIMQRIMSHSTNCTVLYPEDFRLYIVSNLKKMKEGYFEKQ